MDVGQEVKVGCDPDVAVVDKQYDFFFNGVLGLLPAILSVHHTHACCWQRAEERFRFPGTTM